MTKQEIIERMTAEIQVLRNLAKENNGKFLNVTSLGHVKVEQGYGLNNTDYSFDFAHAVVFDTYRRALEAGDLYLKSTTGGKEITIYVSVKNARYFFNNKADELQSTVNWLKEISIYKE